MTAQWDDDVHHALHVALTGETQGYYADFAGGEGRDEAGPLAVLAKVLTRGFLHDGPHSQLPRPRRGARPSTASTSTRRRFLGYLQTHDQVGNRAVGDRISATVAPGPAGHRAPRSTSLAPTTPMVFMGEEWAASTPWQFFTEFEEDWLAEAVREGRRAEFGAHGWAADEVPDPQDPDTRDRSVLRWEEVDAAPHARVLRWYSACTALRRVLLGDQPTRLRRRRRPRRRRRGLGRPRAPPGRAGAVRRRGQPRGSGARGPRSRVPARSSSRGTSRRPRSRARASPSRPTPQRSSPSPDGPLVARSRSGDDPGGRPHRPRAPH